MRLLKSFMTGRVRHWGGRNHLRELWNYLACVAKTARIHRTPPHLGNNYQHHTQSTLNATSHCLRPQVRTEFFIYYAIRVPSLDQANTLHGSTAVCNPAVFSRAPNI